MKTPDAPLMLPANLRVADIIAKTARVTLKDTLRVIGALDAVAFLYDADPAEVIDACTYDFRRPTPEQVAACEQAFFALNEAEHKNALMLKERLRLIRNLS